MWICIYCETENSGNGKTCICCGHSNAESAKKAIAEPIFPPTSSVKETPEKKKKSNFPFPLLSNLSTRISHLNACVRVQSPVKFFLLVCVVLLLTGLGALIFAKSTSAEFDIPSDRIVNVYATYGQTICLKADGTVLVAGKPMYAEYDVSAWTDIKAIAFGGDHIVGLKADGTVVADGENFSGQCNVESWTKEALNK